jgi:DNA-binding transcriptional regulator YiaG
MTTMTTWTGWEANALRKALRMSVTDFAEHLGAARRGAP